MKDLAKKNNQAEIMRLQFATKVVAITLRELGYNREVYAREHELLHTLRTISSAIESQLDTRLGALATAEAARTAAWLRHLRPLVGPGDMVRVVSALNMQDLPHGHEVVLGAWEDASNTSLALLTALREPCQQYCRAHPGWAPLAHALRGGNGTWTGPGYHGVHVHAAYAPLPGTRFGLVYQVAAGALLADLKRELIRTVEAHNDDPKFAKTSEEMAVANRSAAGPHAHVLSRLRFCAGAHPCPLWSRNASKGLDRALGGHEGWHETVDYRGRRVLEAFEPIPILGLALTLKVDWAEVYADFRKQAAHTFDVVNTQLDNTEELLLVAKGANDSHPVDYLTHFRFRDECAPGSRCAYNLTKASYLEDTVRHCANGTGQGNDYRNSPVMSGFTCLDGLDMAVVFEVDQAQVDERGINLIRSYVEEENHHFEEDPEGTMELLMFGALNGTTADSLDNIGYIAPVLHPEYCSGKNVRGYCAGAEPFMLEAMKHKTGKVLAPDYKGEEALTAYSYVHVSKDLPPDAQYTQKDYWIGFAIKESYAKIRTPGLLAARNLALIAAGITLVALMELWLVVRWLLNSIEAEWVEGKKAIEHEKKQFSGLVEAMYPSAVAERLMSGESQIVIEVPNATVFFADIHNFTALSNSIDAYQLIQFVGYTFGVMDTIAEWTHVYKIKTIGDAYLAIAGLPDYPRPNPTHDMVTFASYCAQIFSRRYRHPDAGAILSLIAGKALVAKSNRRTVRMAGDRGNKRPSVTSAAGSSKYSFGAGSGTGTSRTSQDGPGGLQRGDEAAAPHCVMRYGVACGPVTAGVLQGKAPLFDVWGKTVNLASRLESTGVPGVIQISEAAYVAVTRDPACAFQFDRGHKTFCKGFGTLTAYSVRETYENPPKELLSCLGIEPNLGTFAFEDPTATHAYVAPTTGVKHGSASGPQSVRDSARSAQHSEKSRMDDIIPITDLTDPGADSS
uniref:Guanylate cyclase domain-containing protein n=1 Tax=Eutreptiella gymnastica TaxID=73025 RepID=A0A7S4G4S8_9EUGL